MSVPNPLSAVQYNVVLSAFTFMVAAMLTTVVLVLFVQRNVAKRYRTTLIISALVAVITGVYYFNLCANFIASYELTNDQYVATGRLLGSSYRYIDWLLTVPLLVTQMVLILDIPARRRRSLVSRSAVAAALMIALGYPGEILDDVLMRVLWGFASIVPFTYILSIMSDELSDGATKQLPRIRNLYRGARLLLLASWGFHPLVYLLPVVGMQGALIGEAKLFVGVQLGYTLADITAKVGFGLMLYLIAQAKTDLIEGDGTPGAFAMLDEYAWSTENWGIRPREEQTLLTQPADLELR